jgi:tetratricopeptide (TPR) repeat protein/dienelactone hydrolase
MRGATARVAVGVLLAALIPHLGCEKETHRAARRAFQDILARDLPSAEEAKALEEFVRTYPEPKTNPSLVRACGILAEFHARAGRPDIAASWYERAVRAGPDDPDLLNVLGYFYARNRMNLDRAVTLLDMAVRLAEERQYSPRRVGLIKDSLGWAYRMRGDLPLAVALLEEASRLAPGVGVIQEHLAEAYHAIGERDKAVAIDLDLYLKTRGTDVDLRDTLRAIGREGGGAYAREIDKRIESGLRDLLDADRRETEAAGARLVRLRAADGQTLYGSLYRPRDGPAGGPPRASALAAGVLLLHPLASSRSACAAAASALAGRGLVALAIDLRGHGASVSMSLPDARAFSAHLGDSLRDAEEDVRAGLVFLGRQPGVDRRRLGIVGGGLGALLAARATLWPEDDPRPKALVLLSPWGRPDAYRAPLARLPADAVFLIAGSEEGTPLATTRALAVPGDGGAPHSLIVAGPGAHFELTSTDPGLLANLVSFLEARLAPEGRAAPRAGRG